MNHKVSLKIPSFEDYEHFYDSRFQPDVVYWADERNPEIDLDQYAYFRMAANDAGEIIERIIVLDGEPIGTITARDLETDTMTCTLGVVIAFPKYWGQGFGFAALKMFITMLAMDEGIKAVILETYAANKRAQKCFNKLGFQKRRVFFASSSGRFVVQMIKRIQPQMPIGECIKPGDPRWKDPKHI